MISIKPLSGCRKKSRPTSNPDFETPHPITSGIQSISDSNNPLTAEASAVLKNYHQSLKQKYNRLQKIYINA